MWNSINFPAVLSTGFTTSISRKSSGMEYLPIYCSVFTGIYFSPKMQRISRFASTHVTAPIALHGIDGRYATALFTAASKNSELAKVEADLTRISALFAKDPAVQSFLENPLIDRASKKKGVDIIVELGKYSMLTNNFMHVLADNGRLALTKTILASFAKLMSASRGEVSITVTSAKVFSFFYSTLLYASPNQSIKPI